MEIKHDKVDAVIVGAGAGGGIVAKQLAVAGFKCVLLERGQWPDYDDSPKISAPTQYAPYTSWTGASLSIPKSPGLQTRF